MKTILQSALVWAVAVAPLSAVEIDNDIPSGTLGHFLVDVDSAGDVETAYVTAELSATGGLTTDQVIYEYIAYIDIGDTTFPLSNSTIVEEANLTADDEVNSAGYFIGSNGNEIHWTATSRIAGESDIMSTEYVFTAKNGTFGELVLHQYLDEDVNDSVSDDVLLSTGSAGASNLQLFTMDGPEVYGISHSGAFSVAQGLFNAEFIGWAADEYSDLRSAINNQSVTVSKTGVINYENLPSYIHPVLGQTYGPEDVTSTMAWRIDPNARGAVVVTTLGGVPTAGSINLGGTITVTYVKGNEQIGTEHWEDLRVWNYKAGGWEYTETRWHSLNLPYELTDLDPTSSYWLGAWNYTTNQWDVSLYISTYDLLNQN